MTYSPSTGPAAQGTSVHRGDFVGYLSTSGAWALMRDTYGQYGYVLRSCISVPRPGAPSSYLWPAISYCEGATFFTGFDTATGRPAGTISQLKSGQQVGYDFRASTAFPARYAAIRVGAGPDARSGFVRRACVVVHRWVTWTRWMPSSRRAEIPRLLR